jgi:hypothetical protein
MKQIVEAVIILIMVFVSAGIGYAQVDELKDGGPKYIYVKPLKKSPLHMPYDEEMKCIDCHKWDGVDAYTSATMSLTKSKKGRLPKEEIKAAILDTLKGRGNYREMYVLASSFNNKPLATCMEYTIDPESFIFYASSEKQGEKLFHLAVNSDVSIVYVKFRDDLDYFKDPIGVQIVGKAEQLKLGDPGFEEAFDICLSSVIMPEGMILTPEFRKVLEKNQLVTKITPKRIIITHYKFRSAGHHFKQIWEADDNR